MIEEVDRQRGRPLFRGSESQGSLEEGTTVVTNVTKKLPEMLNWSVRLQYGRVRIGDHSVKGRGLI